MYSQNPTENALDDFANLYRDVTYSAATGLLHSRTQTRQILCSEIDFLKLSKFSPELSKLLLESPDAFFEIADKIYYEDYKEANTEGSILIDEAIYRPRIVMPKIIWSNPDWQIKIKDLDKNKQDKYILVEGIIKSVIDPTFSIVEQTFKCDMCDAPPILRRATLKGIKKPKACPLCAGNRWVSLKKVRTETMSAVLESIDTNSKGTQHYRLKLEVEGDWAKPELRDIIRCGKKVRVGGILRVFDEMQRDGTIKRRPISYLEVNDVEVVDNESMYSEITPDDLIKIKELGARPDIVQHLSDTIFGSIYGLDTVKQAIICQMFGGVEVNTGGNTTSGDIHILLIGDAARGKSSLLKITQNVMPGALYAAGKSTSGVGLTATVKWEELTNSWVAEAGLMPMADGGILLLDEFDKIDKEDKSALHQAMAEGFVTVAKANVHATFRCKCGILAAANPKSGRFDTFEDFYKQFDLPPTLVNRFDVIFPIVDRVDKSSDEAIIDVITKKYLPDASTPISLDLIRKYIVYAKTLSPKLTPELFKRIKEVYTKIRQSSVKEGGLQTIPITPRQINAIIRFSQASAKISLREFVEPQDLEFAIKLVTNSIEEITHKDIDILETGISTNKRMKARKAKDIFEELYRVNKHQPISENEFITKIVTELGLSKSEAEETIDKYCEAGDIIRPRNGFLLPGYQSTLLKEEEVCK